MRRTLIILGLVVLCACIMTGFAKGEYNTLEEEMGAPSAVSFTMDEDTVLSIPLEGLIEPGSLDLQVLH